MTHEHTYTAEEAARLLQVSLGTVYNWKMAGKITSTGDGPDLAFTQSEIDRLNAVADIELTPAVRDALRRARHAAGLTIDDVYRATGYHVGRLEAGGYGKITRAKFAMLMRLYGGSDD